MEPRPYPSIGFDDRHSYFRICAGRFRLYVREWQKTDANLLAEDNHRRSPAMNGGDRKSGNRRRRWLIRQGRLTWLVGLFVRGIRIRLAGNAPCHADGRMCQQRPGQNANLIGFKPCQFGTDSRIDLHSALLGDGPTRLARIGTVHSIECTPAQEFPTFVGRLTQVRGRVTPRWP